MDVLSLFFLALFDASHAALRLPPRARTKSVSPLRSPNPRMRHDAADAPRPIQSTSATSDSQLRSRAQHEPTALLPFTGGRKHNRWVGARAAASSDGENKDAKHLTLTFKGSAVACLPLVSHERSKTMKRMTPRRIHTRGERRRVTMSPTLTKQRGVTECLRAIQQTLSVVASQSGPELTGLT